MDSYLIIEFPTETEANQCLYVINQIASSYWQSQGYTVIDGQLIGKNALTGEDMPDSAKTITWDTVKQSPINTFYIISPNVDERFSAWRDRLPEGLTFPADTLLPQEWIPVEE